MSVAEHRFVQTNGIKMHIAEQGQGPLVVLCHGFPETSYSWRHQVEPIAEAGCHVVVPDQRGYGRTDCPERTESYDILSLAADMIGLVHALGQSQAVVIGSDWGSVVAAHCALLRPDIFKAVGLLSVPFLPRTWGKHRPTEFFKRMSRDKVFYQAYFQEPGKAEAELEADPRKSLLALLYSLSGDVPPERRWQHMLDPHKSLLESATVPEKLPPWITEKDLDTFVEDFRRTGFRGGLSWYRNIDRNWELTAFLSEARIQQPSIFLAGESDPILSLYRDFGSQVQKSMPNLRENVILKGVGHWLTQERPQELNRHLLSFLGSITNES